MATFRWSVVGALLCATVLIPATSRAGPWVQPPGETYTELAASHFRSTGTFTEGGALDSNPPYTYKRWSARLYSEIGLVRHLAVGFNLPFQESRNTVDRLTHYINRGPGDLDVFAQVGTSFGNCAISGRFNVRVPLYGEGVGEDGSPVTTGGRGGRFMPVLGDGSVDLTPTANFGCSTGPMVPGWFGVEVGPNFRFGGFGNGVDYSADFGLYLWPERLALTARAGGVERFSAQNARPTKSFLSVEGGLFANLTDRFGVKAAGGTIPTGAFVARGWRVSLGLAYDGPIWNASDDSS